MSAAEQTLTRGWKVAIVAALLLALASLAVTAALEQRANQLSSLQERLRTLEEKVLGAFPAGSPPEEVDRILGQSYQGRILMLERRLAALEKNVPARPAADAGGPKRPNAGD